MCREVGIQRTVQVSASVYGHDNSLTAQVIEQLAQDRARGVAGVLTDISGRELERLHIGRFRGGRLSTHMKGYGGTEAIQLLDPVLRPFGWQTHIHLVRVNEIAALEPQLMAISAPLVFDHMGGVRGDERPDCAGFQALLRILQRRDDCWVKISSRYRRRRGGNFSDMQPFVPSLVEMRPDRLAFGSDWPHPNLFNDDPVPDNGALVDEFCRWCLTQVYASASCSIIRGRLYGFDE